MSNGGRSQYFYTPSTLFTCVTGYFWYRAKCLKNGNVEGSEQHGYDVIGCGVFFYSVLLPFQKKFGQIADLSVNAVTGAISQRKEWDWERKPANLCQKHHISLGCLTQATLKESPITSPNEWNKYVLTLGPIMISLTLSCLPTEGGQEWYTEAKLYSSRKAAHKSAPVIAGIVIVFYCNWSVHQKSLLIITYLMIDFERTMKIFIVSDLRDDGIRILIRIVVIPVCVMPSRCT